VNFDHNDKMAAAWQRGLDVLKPSSAQLEHGLELHEQLFTCDIFLRWLEANRPAAEVRM